MVLLHSFRKWGLTLYNSFVKILEILVVNFVLYGDNALVIALATMRLTPYQRKYAILYGTVASIVLRIILTMVTSHLLNFPYLQAMGGFVLLYLAMSLLLWRDKDETTKQTRSPHKVLAAVFMIVFADLTMSLDNVVALAGIAAGNEHTLIIGLILSITLIMIATNFIAAILTRFRFLRYLGAAVLAWTAGGMIGRDQAIIDIFGSVAVVPMILALLVSLGIVLLRQAFTTNE